jgi:hypothetical protein
MDETTDNLDEGVSLLIAELEKLRHDVVADAETRLAPFKDYFRDGIFTFSGRNLAHYLSLRRFDLRPLQARLTAWGLSSLGRGEPHVLLNKAQSCAWKMLAPTAYRSVRRKDLIFRIWKWSFRP